jgi:hypothetical protein
MLRKDVVAAVRAGTFYVYAVDTIDERLRSSPVKPAGLEIHGAYGEARSTPAWKRDSGHLRQLEAVRHNRRA